MKIMIINSNGCPFRLRDYPELRKPAQNADIIIERFAPFAPFVMKDRYGDTKISEYRHRWPNDGYYELKGTKNRDEQELSHEAPR